MSRTLQADSVESEHLAHGERLAGELGAVELVEGFFLTADKVQVKHEMLQARLVEAVPVAETAAAQGYSRAAVYLVAAAFEQSGMAGSSTSSAGIVAR